MARRGNKAIKKPKAAATVKAMDQLVSQFANPLAFLRELVQNSLDACTELIEVEVDYDRESECCFVRVRDTGVGMDRQIIDTKLTRLFSSSKENDLTKIGKFGIGFVSIFAVAPRLVVLETGRDGESWRLLFKPDRSFERRQLKEPVEGTCITVFLPRGQEQLARLREDCRETVAFWCRHAEVEIQFNGQVLNQPFDLSGVDYSYRHAIEGTDLVVAPIPEPVGFHGYYNRGLTLLEEPQGSPLPHLSFKLRSRYLEHTLSRDNVMFDEGYERALAEVKLAAYHDMPVDLADRLSRQDDPRLWVLARVVARFPEPARQAFEKAAIFPSHGRNLKRSTLGPSVYIHPQVDDFWKAVEATGVTIVKAEPGDGKTALLKELGCQAIPLETSFLQFRLHRQPPPEWQALLQALRETDRSLRRLVLIEGLRIPEVWRNRFCGYVQPERGVATVPCPDQLDGTDCVAVFAEHPFWKSLVQLFSKAPELALSMGVRKIMLDLGRGADREGKLFGQLVKTLRARTEGA
jgi:hypothetical protein